MIKQCGMDPLGEEWSDFAPLKKYAPTVDKIFHTLAIGQGKGTLPMIT